MQFLYCIFCVCNYIFLENHFGGLLDSDSTSRLVDSKIDSILARPEGMYVCLFARLFVRLYLFVDCCCLLNHRLGLEPLKKLEGGSKGKNFRGLYL